MADQQLKQDIQQAYTTFLSTKEWTPRFSQKQMIAAIYRCLSLPQLPRVCAIEAGTGTGKTVSYLLAAIPIAKLFNKRLIVSTATIALQEQLIGKDIPDLQQCTPLEFDYALAKGRRHYLCLLKLDNQLNHSNPQQSSLNLPIDLVELSSNEDSSSRSEMLERLLNLFASGQWNGERDNLPEEVSDPDWFSMTAQSRECTNRNCSFFKQCAYFKARAQADRSDLIVANHDLVLADLALGGGVLLPSPKDSIYIFDEGHHLSEKAKQHFSTSIRYSTSKQWVARTTKSIVAFRQAFPDFCHSFLNKIDESLTEIEPLLLQAHLDINHYLDSQDITYQWRFPHGIVTQELQTLATDLLVHYRNLRINTAKVLEELKELLTEQEDLNLKELVELWYPIWGVMLDQLEGFEALWVDYKQPDIEDAPPKARWITRIEYQTQKDFILTCSHISGADQLSEMLWYQCYGAVITSATLSVNNNFQRFMEDVGAPEEAKTIVLPSPFDFYDKAVLRVVDLDFKAQTAQEHTDSLIDLLPSMVDLEKGTLVLFGSRRQLEQVLSELPKDFCDNVLSQDNYGKGELLDLHRQRIDNQQGSVLFGLASLAEGVDLPGQYLQHVIITKLPFAVPDDPIYAALSEWLEKNGSNSFMELAVPGAIIRMKQACGRLLRSERDEGIISLLDNRIVTKRYGSMIFESLPPFRREFVKLDFYKS